MTATSTDVGTQARFAAREFVAHWKRETGEQLADIVLDRMLFAFEIGFTRGWSEGMRHGAEVFGRSSARKRVKMTTPNDPNVKVLSPQGLANQLFDAAMLQNPSSGPQETARHVIVFLTEALVYAISSTAGDEGARQALLKSVAEMIAAAPPLRPGAPGHAPTPAAKP